MDILDRLALSGRKYRPRRSAITGRPHLSLDEVLRAFHGKTILDIEVKPYGKEATRLVHQRGRPVSLLDSIAEIGGDGGNQYEVQETAPSGDYTKARITAQPGGGQIAMLLGRRQPEHAPSEDALLDELQSRASQG